MKCLCPNSRALLHRSFTATSSRLFSPNRYVGCQRGSRMIVCGTGFGDEPEPKSDKEKAVVDTPEEVKIEDDDELAIEARLRRRKRPKSKVKVDTPFVDSMQRGEVPSEEAEFETNAIYFLLALFTLILIEGVFIAGSGFLPEGLDKFAQNVVYPSFSPTVGFFLLGSTLYGVWKTREQGGDGSQ